MSTEVDDRRPVAEETLLEVRRADGPLLLDPEDVAELRRSKPLPDLSDLSVEGEACRVRGIRTEEEDRRWHSHADEVPEQPYLFPIDGFDGPMGRVRWECLFWWTAERVASGM